MCLIGPLAYHMLNVVRSTPIVQTVAMLFYVNGCSSTRLLSSSNCKHTRLYEFYALFYIIHKIKNESLKTVNLNIHSIGFCVWLLLQFNISITSTPLELFDLLRERLVLLLDVVLSLSLSSLELEIV